MELEAVGAAVAAVSAAFTSLFADQAAAQASDERSDASTILLLLLLRRRRALLVLHRSRAAVALLLLRISLLWIAALGRITLLGILRLARLAVVLLSGHFASGIGCSSKSWARVGCANGCGDRLHGRAVSRWVNALLGQCDCLKKVPDGDSDMAGVIEPRDVAVVVERSKVEVGS